MNGTQPLFFIALGLFGLYAVEFSVVGILPAVVQRHGISVARAGWLVALFAGVVVVCGPAMVLWLSRFDRRKVLTASLLVFSKRSTDPPMNYFDGRSDSRALIDAENEDASNFH